MCFANSVLQLLVHSPPFWDLFRKLRDLKRQREAGGPETGGVAIPLVDATVRFCEEFVISKEASHSTQQPPQEAAGGKLREDEEAKKEHNTQDPLEPIYLYDAMKEKHHLKNLLVCS